MSYILYGIPNCNTVKKARTWLEEKGIAYQFHNYKKEGISEEKVNEWLSQEKPEILVNNRGTTFRKFSDEQKANFKAANIAAQMMLENNSVIKRPILESDREILAVGFKEEVYKEVLS